METDIKQFDGFFMIPDSNDIENAEFNFFNANQDMGNPIGNTEIGDAFHVFLYRINDELELVYDDSFDAIFSDPITYALNVVKAGFYGMWFRKTEKSKKWLDENVESALRYARIIN